MESVLITGASGMLGSSIKQQAIAKNWNFLAPTRNELDLSDAKSTFDFVRDNKIKTVIHCAAKVGGIQANINHPADFILDNSRIDVSVINACRTARVSKFIYFGSSCMYPRLIRQPMLESDILSGALEPTNEGYALAKIVAAKSVQSVARQDGLDWRVLILSNLYGPGDNFDIESSHLIPAVIRKVHFALKQGFDSIDIWGDGQARREFTYVQDVAEFVVNSISQAGNWDLLMNVGIGIDYSINEYYEFVGELLGFTGTFVNDLDRPEGMRQKLMDSSLARKHGWDPKTDLKQGLERTIKWFKIHYQE
jgi:GDP-L-fucose synthase